MSFPKHIDHAQVYGKHTSMYLLHKFWARKPHNIVSHYIERYSKNGEIVLDPFSGSGVVALEAMKLGRKAIAVDLDPLATFMTRMTAIPVDLDCIKKVFEKFKRSVKPEIHELYKIKCPHCGKNEAITQSLVISFVVECPHCQKDVIMAKAEHGKGKKQMIYTCPFCKRNFNYATLRLKGEAFTELKFKCKSCGAKDTILDPSADLIRKEPHEISYWYPDVKHHILLESGS